jgi:hypothetical protein
MKAISFAQLRSIAVSVMPGKAPIAQHDVAGAETTRALIPAPPRVPAPLAQARRLISPDFFENVLRPVGSGFVQALLTHALQPGPAQMQPNPHRPLRAWAQRNLVARTAPQQDQPAPSLPDQRPAANPSPADVAQWRYLHVEVHIWTAGARTSTMTVDIVAVQSVTNDIIQT